MRFGKTAVGILTVILLGLILLAAPQSKEEYVFAVDLSCIVGSGQENERIRCWEGEEGSLYFFLPAYGRMDELFLLPGDAAVTIDGIPVKDRMSCEGFILDEPYSLTYSVGEKTLETTLTFVRSGAVPALYIDVLSGSMEYIHLDKTHEESGSLRLYDVNGDPLNSENVSQLKGRGNTSWTAEKKPYNLTLARETDILGMGAAQQWILLAEGFNRINIRNKIVFDFAAQAGLEYSPDSRWVDLYLNGEYKGLYLLTERNEIHRERIAISEEGSFLVSMENQGNMDNQKIPYVALDSSQVLRTRWSSLQDQEIRNIWTSLRNALLAEDGIDPDTGKSWMDMIDLDSWVRKYLIEEIFANPDGGAVSQYFYLDGADPDRRIHAGPVWDYDYAMGGEEFWMRQYDSFLILAREYTDDGMYLPWFYELYRKDAFYQRLRELYELEFLPLLQELSRVDLDSYAAMILPAAQTDGIRWGYSEEEIRSDISFIRDFLGKRMAFLSDLWINESTYHIIQVNPARYTSGYFAVKDGGVLPELPDYESIGGLGWYDAQTDAPFDVSQPIHQDGAIYIRKKDTALPIIHYLPVLAVIMALPVLAMMDKWQEKRNRRKKHDPAKVN